jgi:hypothetical protein
MSARCKCGAAVKERARCLNGHAQDPAIPLDRLADLVADQLADRIASRLERIVAGFGAMSSPESPSLVDAATIARMLGKRREWVYRSREQLGGVPLGNGPRPRLGFDPDVVRARLEQRNGDEPTPPAPAAAARRLPDAPLLPVKNRSA